MTILLRSCVFLVQTKVNLSKLYIHMLRQTTHISTCCFAVSCRGGIAVDLFFSGGLLQEQRSHDGVWKEISNRLAIVKELSSSSQSESSNAIIASRVAELCQQDAYFAESTVTAESIQCLGFLEAGRSGLDLLQTVDSICFSVFN